MDLRAKLARLKPSSATRGAGAAPAPDPVPVPVPGLDRTTDAPTRIDALRAQLQALVERSRAKEARRAEERRAEIEARLQAAPLPFDEHDTELGPLHVRRVHHAPSHRVGRIPLRAGLEASAQALALLALDPSLRDSDPRGALYVDTEATGLAGGTGTVPFLVGLAWFEGEELVVEQLLLRRLGEEAPILARVADRIAASTMLVSFNGKAFDLPLLKTRFVMNRLAAPPVRPHLDLVHVARRVHRQVRGRREGDPRTGPTEERWTWSDETAAARPPSAHREGAQEEAELRRATSCRLVALERQILGFARVDDVPSSEVPARYGHFLRTGDADAIRSVCDHNLWDVVSMAALVGVYESAVRALDAEATAPHETDDTAAALDGRDLVGIARTLERAGDRTRARRAADAAVEAASSTPDRDLDRAARRTRGGIAKGARDDGTALLDFGVLAAEHDDPGARLELAKLLEHRLRDPKAALEHVTSGTGEAPEAAERRRARLERKVAKQTQLELLHPRRSR